MLSPKTDRIDDMKPIAPIPRQAHSFASISPLLGCIKRRQRKMDDLQPIAINELAAAQILGVSVSSLQKMRVRGDGPRYAKIGTRVRYRIADLEAFVAESIIENTGE